MNCYLLTKTTTTMPARKIVEATEVEDDVSPSASTSGSDSDSDSLDSLEPRKRRKVSVNPDPEDEEEDDDEPPAVISFAAAPSRMKPKQNQSQPTPTKAPVLEPTDSPKGIIAPVDANTTFESLDVRPWLVQSLTNMAIKRPTGIQKGCIPEILKGRDCIGGSRTGSGKTVAFAVPILQKWAENPSGIFAVILTPTRYEREFQSF